MRVLLIEDDSAMARSIELMLRSEGLNVYTTDLGEEGIDLGKLYDYDIIVLDLQLPDMSGFDVCKDLLANSEVPIVFLTARNTELDRVLGLELGGDDYLSKPFSPRELTARVKAILRRTDGNGGAKCHPLGDTSRVQGGAFFVDEERCAITCRGVALELTRYEFRLLKTLIAKPGRVFSRNQLMVAAWEDPGASLDRTVDAHIKTLRAKLRAVAPATDPIQTHRGLGYSLRADR